MPTGVSSHIDKASSVLRRIRAMKVRTSSDRNLALSIQTLFEAEDRLRGLNFYVCDGAVSVYGAVKSATERDIVVQALSGIEGIRRISEHLSLKN